MEYSPVAWLAAMKALSLILQIQENFKKFNPV